MKIEPTKLGSFSVSFRLVITLPTKVNIGFTELVVRGIVFNVIFYDCVAGQGGLVAGVLADKLLVSLSQHGQLCFRVFEQPLILIRQ